MRRLAGLPCAVVAMALLTTAPPAAAETKLKMLYTAVTGFTSAYLAQEAGFFKKRGIDVEFVLTSSSGNNPPALVSGSVQIAGPTMPTVIEAANAGLDIVVFAGGAVYPLVGDVLVARQGSGIEKPADLKGKTVGVPGLGALLHFMLRRSLKANGVDPNSVKYVELGFPQAADALRSGQIDAYPAQAPFTQRILQSGAGYEVANWLKNTPDGTVTVVYATLRKWGMANKETIINLREAMREANEYGKTHVDELYASIAKYTKLPMQVVSSLPPPNLRVDITPEQVQFWINLVKEEGVIKGNPSAKDLLFEP
jgi:NitT/TauT family transport system substrate-binding protein